MREPVGAQHVAALTRLRISRAQFDSMKDDPKFHIVLALGRIINSIRFCLVSMSAANPADLAGANRQLYGSVFYLCAILHEVKGFNGKVGFVFKESAVYQAEFKPILRDREVELLQNVFLHGLRNGAVAHFGPEIMEAGLKGLDSPVYDFATRTGTDDEYFDLSDVAVLSALLESGNLGDLTKRPDEVVGAIRDFSERYVAAAEKLITEYLGDKNCVHAVVEKQS